MRSRTRKSAPVEKYDRLNSLYLHLWSCFDPFFPTDRWLDAVPPACDKLGFLAKRLSEFREGAALRVKLDAEAAKMRDEARKAFLSAVADLEWDSEKRVWEVKYVQASHNEIDRAFEHVRKVMTMLREYAEMDSDVSEWIGRARALKDEMGEKAFEYAGELAAASRKVR